MRKPVKTLPPAESPYLQAFLVAMESGAVALARVMACDMTQGREAARAAALAAMPGGAIWDSAVYPVGPEARADGPGLDILKPGPAFEPEELTEARQEENRLCEEARRLEALAKPRPGPAPQGFTDSEVAAKFARGAALNAGERRSKLERAFYGL